MVTPEALDESKLLIIQPDGPQGAKLGLQIDSAEQMRKFDELVGLLPENQRGNLDKLRGIATELGINEVKS